MERLTDLIGGEDNEYCTYIANEIQVLNKLGKLEDIMEKYRIESVEELETRLCDRDTWEKACELACAYLKAMTLAIETPQQLVENFYAQAQKEMKK